MAADNDELIGADYFLTSAEGRDPTLSFSRSPTVLLQFAAGRFTRAASSIYQKRYGIGATEWRVLVMLTRHPGAGVQDAAETIGIDKGAVSRALSALGKKGLVLSSESGEDGRRRSWTLTKAGRKMHAEILQIALDRQLKLLRGFSAQEVAAFVDMLRRFLDNLEDL